MSPLHESDSVRGPFGVRARLVLSLLIAALLGTAIVFRLMSLSSVPGINGDEGWWGVQAIAWLRGQPYETHTTSGNPIDMFFLIPVALVHLVAKPSFLALRAVPAAVNLMALLVGFWFVRRLYDSTTAWIYTVALAILPAAIVHSRITQDPSQSVFWTGIVIFLAMLGFRERTWTWPCLTAAVLTFAVALWTHPTNVFIAPFLVLPGIDAVKRLTPASRSQRAIAGAAAVLLLIVGAWMAWAALSPLIAVHDHLDRPWLSIAASRMIDGAQWFEFAANTGRLFNGITVYHYFSGARPATLPYDAGFVLVAGALLAGLVRRTAVTGSRRDAALLAACAATGLLFYAFAGPQALRPHAERWGLCLVVPAMLLLARGLSSWLEWLPERRWWTIGAATLVAASLLGSIHVNYFGEFANTGGRSHLTYVTAAAEPKRQAFDRILASRGDADRVAIVARQWWLYWPLAYLATEHPDVLVSTSVDALPPELLQAARRDGSLFFVEFAGTAEVAAVMEWTRSRGLLSSTTAITDAGGRDLLTIVHATPSPASGVGQAGSPRP